MSTLRQLTGGSLAIPAATAWYLADLGEFLDRALHQPGTPGRAEQGPLLRNPGTQFAPLARGQARSVALHQLRAVHSQERLS